MRQHQLNKERVAERKRSTRNGVKKYPKGFTEPHYVRTETSESPEIKHQHVPCKSRVNKICTT